MGSGSAANGGWRALPAFAPSELRRGTSTHAPSRCSGGKRVNWDLDPPRMADGAPCRTRTCDLLVRSNSKGGNRGQRDTAAPMFTGLLSHPRQPENASSRRGLSVICQSERAICDTLARRQKARGNREWSRVALEDSAMFRWRSTSARPMMEVRHAPESRRRSARFAGACRRRPAGPVREQPHPSSAPEVLVTRVAPARRAGRPLVERD